MTTERRAEIQMYTEPHYFRADIMREVLAEIDALTAEKENLLTDYLKALDERGLMLVELEKLTAELAAKDKALDWATLIIQKFVEQNPKFYSLTQQCQQDPMGAHAWLEADKLREREGR